MPTGEASAASLSSFDSALLGGWLRGRVAGAGLVPVVQPVVAFTVARIGVFEEGVVHGVIEVALRAIEVGVHPGGGTGQIGASFEAALRKVAPLTDARRTGTTSSPDRVLSPNRHTGPEQEIAGRLGHHGALPVESRFDLRIVVGVAVRTQVRSL
jgi:hypothetical protein